MADDPKTNTPAPRSPERMPALREREGDTADAGERGDGSEGDAPRSMAERRGEEMKQDREDREKRRQETLQELKRRSEEAERPAAEGSMKTWIVYPGDPQQPPFHFSDTPNIMLVSAPNEDYARRLATQEANNEAWADPDRVGVDEWKPAGPGVLTRDFKG